MANEKKKPDSINPLLVAAIGVVGAILFGLALPVVLVLASPELTASQYAAELLKASITVATGLLLSVVAAMLVENHRLRSARAAADRELRRGLVAQLRDVHDQVKAAALLINAHKSARTYGEQMRRLIEVRVGLLDARRTIAGDPRPFVTDDATLTKTIDSAANYLHELIVEYEKHYLRVSRIQSYSYEWDQAQAKAAARSEAPPVPEHMKSSLVPWKELTSPAFERLRALLEVVLRNNSIRPEQAQIAPVMGAALGRLTGG